MTDITEVLNRIDCDYNNNDFNGKKVSSWIKAQCKWRERCQKWYTICHEDKLSNDGARQEKAECSGPDPPLTFLITTLNKAISICHTTLVFNYKNQVIYLTRVSFHVWITLQTLHTVCLSWDSTPTKTLCLGFTRFPNVQKKSFKKLFLNNF